MKYLQTVLIASQILILVLSGRIKDKLFAKRKIEIYRLDGRCVGKDVIMFTYMQGCSVDSMLRGFCANVTTIIKIDYDRTDYKCSFHVKRCRSRENLDSCEEVYSRGNMSACQLVNANKIGQSPLAIPFQPPITCPGKKGIHVASNFSLNYAPFIFFPIEDWYWQLDIKMYSPDNTKLLGCGVLQIRQVIDSQT